MHKNTFEYDILLIAVVRQTATVVIESTLLVAQIWFTLGQQPQCGSRIGVILNVGTYVPAAGGPVIQLSVMTGDGQTLAVSLRKIRRKGIDNNPVKRRQGAWTRPFFMAVVVIKVIKTCLSTSFSLLVFRKISRTCWSRSFFLENILV